MTLPMNDWSDSSRELTLGVLQELLLTVMWFSLQATIWQAYTKHSHPKAMCLEGGLQIPSSKLPLKSFPCLQGFGEKGYSVKPECLTNLATFIVHFKSRNVPNASAALTAIVAGGP
jgi:hypothetical protein